MTTTTIEDRLTRLFNKATTHTLIESLTTLESTPATPERNFARTHVIQELERRHPEAAQAVEDAYLETEKLLMAGVDTPEVNYVAVLIAHRHHHQPLRAIR